MLLASLLTLSGCRSAAVPSASVVPTPVLPPPAAAAVVPAAAVPSAPAPAVTPNPAPPPAPVHPASFAIRKLSHGPRDRREVAITIDDGPHPGYTPRLLATLKEYGVTATFFVVGKMAEQYPDLVRAEVAAGHLVANHTYDHLELNRLRDRRAIAAQITKGADVIGTLTGVRPCLLRPPYGFHNEAVDGVADKLKQTMVLWSLHSGDTGNVRPREVVRRVRSAVRSGDIILLHDGFPATPQALPDILAFLKSEGYRCVTVDEMLRPEAAQ